MTTRIEAALAELEAARQEARRETVRQRAAARMAERIRHATVVMADDPRDWHRVCLACGGLVVGYQLPGGGEVMRCERGHRVEGRFRVVAGQ